ncbi:methyltransferase domain-containing protein [Sphingomonas sp. LB-2]|uniref:class I SAM-dependent methyltransferase n=1 Tax=Sphingomonas caeni TaxID=2984949 RepID=UPI00222F65BF|nr:methyltransferase domain-containing protein [Sphingomonas caeni]MCW3849345.1 methyltransferase domain-containing protein [Sphingomonas caeni]
MADAATNRFVQYGCGLSAPAGWRNFDASPTLRAKRLPLLGLLLRRVGAPFPENAEFGDVTRRLPVADNAAELVYCSHVLEHLPLDGFRAALAETFRILQPGGIFRLVVPDLEVLIDQYKASNDDDAAVKFVRDTIMGQETRPRGLGASIRDMLGNAQHRWMWDYRSLASELAATGFIAIRRAQFGDNANPALSAIEDESRWIDCLGIECRKP